MLGLARASGRIRGSRTLAVSLCGGLAFGGAVQSCRVVSTHSSGALQVFPGSIAETAQSEEAEPDLSPAFSHLCWQGASSICDAIPVSVKKD